MIQISEEDAKIVCERFFKEHQWERLPIINHSQIGLNPLIILNKETNPVSVHLYDNYQSVIKDIRKIVEAELQDNNGYSESFYLSYEDIDNLELQKYVVHERDAEKIIDQAKSIINYF
jgi:hypothetical protein